jgi:Flp pilus assembly protein TadD
MLGLLARETGRLATAPDLMLRSVTAAPYVPEFHNNLGLLLADCDRLKESAAALETACRLAPNGSVCCFNLGNTRCRQRQSGSRLSANVAPVVR